MASDPRIEELLERYPSELDDSELAELRAAAATDPDVDAAMHALLLTDAVLDDADLSATLSPAGQRREDATLRAVRAWTLGPAAPTEAKDTSDAPKAWTLGPAAPTEANADNVVDFSAARRRRMRTLSLAIAAAILVALGFAARGWFGPSQEGGGYDPYGGGTKGDDDSAPAIEGQIQIMGATRIHDGDAVPATTPVRFTMRLEDPASIALIEIQGGTTAVLWPRPDHQWLAIVGNNALAPRGTDGTYTPAAAGEANYVLVGSESALQFADPKLSTLDAFIKDNGALVLDQITVRWTEGDSTP